MKHETPAEAQKSEAAPKEDTPAPISIEAAIFKDVQVAIEARLGATTLTIEEILALRSGAIVKLDLKMNELIDLRLNGSVVARGEIVAVDDNFGVRIVEVAQLK
ncbi:MAG: flagellar motor switch protein FliN [Caulobacteraceae bacterium]|nr:flagellar motor switch protein FliN [Caulobacteraceae bacterium]